MTKSRITEVVEGDTIKVRALEKTRRRSYTVRLIGIDTLETNKPGTAVECGGLEATSSMYDLAFTAPSDIDGDGLFDTKVGTGRKVMLLTDPTQDRFDGYRRLLAYAMPSAGRTFQGTQLRRGSAKVYVFHKRFLRYTAFRRSQEAARAAGRGAWGLCGGRFHRGGPPRQSRPAESQSPNCSRSLGTIVAVVPIDRHSLIITSRSRYSSTIEGHQHIVVRLRADIARAAHALAGSPAYADLSELVEVALANQLALEGELDSSGMESRGRGRHEPSPKDADALRQLLARPEAAPASVQPQPAATDPLYSLTNRLFPIKVAARVLAHPSDERPSLARYQDAAAGAARELGIRLRAVDEADRRRGAERRWIALPVGDDKPAALSRYIHHFTLTLTGDGRPSGPLAQLRLAAVDESGTPGLTELGAQLALSENPVLDTDGEATGDLLGGQERDLFIRAINGNPAEVAAVREFVDLCRDHGGHQADVDAGLRVRHAGWSSHQAVAQRAAMVGRLRDLGLAEVEGRGPSARIRLAPETETYWEDN